jgi:hypothetical protein
MIVGQRYLDIVGCARVVRVAIVKIVKGSREPRYRVKRDDRHRRDAHGETARRPVPPSFRAQSISMRKNIFIEPLSVERVGERRSE